MAIEVEQQEDGIAQFESEWDDKTTTLNTIYHNIMEISDEDINIPFRVKLIELIVKDCERLCKEMVENWNLSIPYQKMHETELDNSVNFQTLISIIETETVINQ